MHAQVSVLRELQGCPSVVRLHGVYEDESYAYLIMELCGGGTLGDVLDARGALPEHEAAAVLRQLLEAVRAAHARGTCYGVRREGGGGGGG